MATATLLEAALKYHKHFNAPVIPVADTKQSLCGWRQWRFGGQTEEAVNDVFSLAAHGLALLTWPASPIAVMDFDGPHARGAWNRSGPPLPKTARTFTPHGEHYLYGMPPGIERDELKRKIRIVSAGSCGCAKACGVDLLVNGYFVVPPTPGYREDPDNPLAACLARLPDAVIDLARRHRGVDGKGTERFTVPERILEGERNATMYRLSRSLKARGMSTSAILAALREENKARCEPPLADQELEQIAEHAATQADRPEFQHGVTGNASESRDGEPTPQGLSRALIEYPELLTLEIPERRRHTSWLPESSSALAYGPRGVGKTMWGLGLGTALVTGESFLRWPITAPVGCLYVDGEMQIDELRARATALLPTPPRAPLLFLTSELAYHRLNRDLVLTSQAAREEVAALLNQHPEIRVVIFDNISTLFAGIDEDRKRDWEPIAAWLIRLRHRGLATVLIHHSGKGGQQRGTSGREDSLDTVIQLDRPVGYDPREGCHFELRFTKSRSVKGEDVAPLDVTLTEQDGQLRWAYKTLEESRFDQVKRLLEEGVTSPTEIGEELGITKGYASKLVRKARAEQGQR